MRRGRGMRTPSKRVVLRVRLWDARGRIEMLEKVRSFSFFKRCFDSCHDVQHVRAAKYDPTVAAPTQKYAAVR